MTNSLFDQISSFSEKEVQELYEHDKYPIWDEHEFYKKLDKSRREIFALFHEIDQAYGSWEFMDRVIPGLFRELYDIFKNTLKIIKNSIKSINYKIWIDNSWRFLPEYRELQNEESKYYYLLEYLVSKFETDFISIKKLSEQYSKSYYDRTWKKTKIRISNVFYYFHQKAIKQLRSKAHECFAKTVSSKLKELDLPIITYVDSLLYDLNIYYCKSKLNELFKPAYGSREYDLGLKPIWTDDENGIISAFYFNKIENPFVLLTNLDNSRISQSIKDSGDEEVFQEWFYTPEVYFSIINYSFNSIYLKYLRKKELSQVDIEESKRKIYNAYLKLKEYYGITDSLSELFKHFRLEQKILMEKEAPFHTYDFESGYDPDWDIQAHFHYILNSIFPMIRFSWSDRNYIQKEKEPEEIAIIDLETTGDNPYSDAIVEIGICKLNLKTRDIEPLFNKICQEKNKEIAYDAWIFKNSNLEYYDVREAPDLITFRKEIQHILNEYAVTSYNQNFDFNFLKNRGFKIQKKFWDPMFKAQYILKIPRYNGDYKWPSFQEAWDHFFPNQEFKIKHRAYDDAFHEAQLIYEIYKIEKEAKEKNGS